MKTPAQIPTLVLGPAKDGPPVGSGGSRYKGWSGMLLGWLVIFGMVGSVSGCKDSTQKSGSVIATSGSETGSASLLPKMDSHLVLALKKSRGEPPFDHPTQLDPDVVIEKDGRVLVDIQASVSDELIEFIKNEGGEVINSFESARAIRAMVPLGRAEALAGRKDVQFIAPAAQATTNAIGGSGIRP